MRRKTIFMTLVVFIAAILSVGDLNAAPDRPNIIFIMADDLGYGDFGCFGSDVIQTPNIDQLAREGMRFTHAYSGHTVCAPARSTLMTGQHTGHTTVRDNMGGKKGVKGLAGASGRVPLNDDDVTVAEVLKRAGYATGAYGKWGLGEPRTSGHPVRQGFDRWFGYLNQRRAHSYYRSYLWSNRSKVELPDGTYTHYPIEERSLQFIQDNQDNPFFLYLAYTLPHSKFTIPDDDPATEPYEDKENWTERQRTYAAMVTRFDRSVGKVVNLLEKHGIRDRTLIFVTSDNGGSPKFQDAPIRTNRHLRGGKRDMYEGGIRVPMVVSWPGQVPQGETSSLPWYFPDFLPTAAEIAGVNNLNIDPLDGISIVPALNGRNQPELRNRPMYWEYPSDGFKQAARLGKWKAVRNGANNDIELYNLNTDEEETNNVADQPPELVSKFKTLFVEGRTPSPSWPFPLD